MALPPLLLKVDSTLGAANPKKINGCPHQRAYRMAPSTK